MDEPSKSESADADVRSRFDRAYGLLQSDRNSREAVDLLKKNIGSGCTDSMVLLGVVYCNGTEDERRESIELFRKAAYLGDDSGLRNLAYCYAVGINVEKDKSEGVRLYRIAAEKGNAKAMCNLGVMLDYGNGTEQDFDEAFKWFLRSAEGGYSRGMTNVGVYYQLGKGTEKDLEKAEHWYRRSGTPRALYRLSEIMIDEYGRKEEGLEYLEKSASGGYSKALFRLGSMIESDEPDRAVDMYKQAAAKGNQNAIDRLQELGEDVPERRRKKK